MMKRLILASAAIGGLLFGGAASALPTVLDDSARCGAGNASFISISDVTGNVGNPSDCWGAFDGNDTGPSGDGYSIDGMTYEFVSKLNTPGGPDGQDIDLQVSPIGASSGDWSFDGDLFDPDEFLLVLKAANSPGYAVWLFDGSAADSTSGTWEVAWTVGGGGNNPALSHLSIYAKTGGGPGGGNNVPEGSTLSLMALSGLGLLAVRRRRRR